MKQCVCKLLLEDVSLQEPRDAFFQAWNLKQLVDCRSLCWISLKHHRNQVCHVPWIVARHGRVLAGDDPLSQLMERLGIKRGLKSRHFVQQHTKWPNVRLEVVAFTFDNLGRKVVRSPDYCLGSWFGIWKQPCYASTLLKGNGSLLIQW